MSDPRGLKAGGAGDEEGHRLDVCVFAWSFSADQVLDLVLNSGKKISSF